MRGEKWYGHVCYGSRCNNIADNGRSGVDGVKVR